MDTLKIGILTIIIDYFYLSFIKNKFNKMIVKIQGSEIELNYFAAALCYLLLIFCLKYFVIDKKFTDLEAFYLGIIIYGIYETTSAATLKNWSNEIIILDTIWGGILFYLISKIFKSKLLDSLL